MDRSVLVVGFEPFRSFRYNPSAEIARLMGGKIVHGCKVTSIVLPVSFGEDAPPVLAAIDRLSPAAVILSGLNSGANCVEVERFAVNLRTTDEPEEQIPILDGAPLAYESTLPVQTVVQEIRGAGVPARAHAYAGAYLCNHLYYSVLHHLAQQTRAMPCGFLHLPHATECLLDLKELTYPSLPLLSLVKAVEASIGTVVRSEVA